MVRNEERKTLIGADYKQPRTVFRSLSLVESSQEYVSA